MKWPVQQLELKLKIGQLADQLQKVVKNTEILLNSETFPESEVALDLAYLFELSDEVEHVYNRAMLYSDTYCDCGSGLVPTKQDDELQICNECETRRIEE